MPVFRLDDRLVFPPPEQAEDGLLAVGGDLRPERLILAYSSGIFPWYSEGQPILWHSPDPRFVLVASRLRIGRTLKKTLRKQSFELSLDTGFRDVMSACAEVPRPGQDGTWITAEMLEAYCELHRLGLAHSVEVRRGAALVGGLYGVSLGGVFFGESMFSRTGEASKAGFVTLVAQLRRWGIGLIDSQVHTAHLERFGAELWPRERYLKLLRRAMGRATRKGNWVLDHDLAHGVVPGATRTGETEAGVV